MGAFPSTTRFAKTTPELRAAELEVLEAQADSQRAEAEVKRAEVARLNRSATVGDLRTLLPLVLGVSLAAGLALDFYRHESPSYIRRRMLATLRSYRMPPAPATSSLVASRMLPVPREPLKLGPLPTMVLGPTGCGKSTLLASLARESASLKNGARSPTPTVFVRMRLPSAVAAARDIDTHRTASLAETHQLIDSQAVAVFRQIGYPVRRAMVIAVPEALKMKMITDFGFQVEFESPKSAFDGVREAASPANIWRDSFLWVLIGGIIVFVILIVVQKSVLCNAPPNQLCFKGVAPTYTCALGADGTCIATPI